MRLMRKGASRASAQHGGWLGFQPLSRELWCSSESGEKSRAGIRRLAKVRVMPSLGPAHSNPCSVCWTFNLAIRVPSGDFIVGEALRPTPRSSDQAVKSAKPAQINNANVADVDSVPQIRLSLSADLEKPSGRRLVFDSRAEAGMVRDSLTRLTLDPPWPQTRREDRAAFPTCLRATGNGFPEEPAWTLATLGSFAFG
jgi:hypothetical protein